MTLLPHRPGVDLDIQLEDRHGLPVKKIYALSQDKLEEHWNYIEQNEEGGWIRETYSAEDLESGLSKRRTESFNYRLNTEDSTTLPRKTGTPYP